MILADVLEGVADSINVEPLAYRRDHRGDPNPYEREKRYGISREAFTDEKLQEP